MIARISQLLAKATVVLVAFSASTYALAGGDLIPTKIRLSQGSGPSSLQLDLFNRGYINVRASALRVVLPDFGYADANARLYQYYGGTSGEVDVVMANELGYIPFSVPAHVALEAGQLIHVRLESPDGRVNPIDAYVYACQKGSRGCE